MPQLMSKIQISINSLPKVYDNNSKFPNNVILKVKQGEVIEIELIFYN